MSLQDITDKILADARAEAQKIADANKADIASLTLEKGKELNEAIKEIEDKGKDSEDKLKEQAEFKIRMIKKNASLKIKQELIDESFNEAKKKLMHLDDTAYTKLLTSMFKNAQKLEDAEIIAGKEKKAQVAKAAKEAGLSYKVSDKHLADNQEGFILSSKTIEINNTIDSLVDAKREELEVEVANILFK